MNPLNSVSSLPHFEGNKISNTPGDGADRNIDDQITHLQNSAELPSTQILSQRK
jgi:hypothetical protein